MTAVKRPSRRKGTTISFDPEDKVPVLFEIDAITDEATGTVHPFCSHSCRDAKVGEITLEAPERGFGIVAGEDASGGLDRQVVCENNGHPVFRV
jgi:hypothetical protein